MKDLGSVVSNISLVGPAVPSTDIPEVRTEAKIQSTENSSLVMEQSPHTNKAETPAAQLEYGQSHKVII